MGARKKLPYVLLALVFCAGVIYGASYLLSLRTMTINFQNINKVLIYDSKKLDSGKSEKPIKEVSSSGQEVKLRKGSYTLRYEGKENYQSLFVDVELKEKNQVVNLKSDFTDEYLNALLDKELSGINQAISKTFPKIGLYEIERGKLYRGGEWYGTTLVYKGRGVLQGAELFITDTLRVVLKKESGKWIVKTTPPNILLNKYTYKDVPLEILRDVNTLPTSN